MTLFETERTLIRRFNKEDFDSLFEMMSDPEVVRLTGFKEPQTKEKVAELLATWSAEEDETLGTWVAQDKSSSDLIVWVMLKMTSYDAPELGFMLPKRFWNQGFATEVSLAFLDYAQNLKIKKVIATVSKNNPASIKVLKKIGMTLESEKNGIFHFYK